jgi:hypothetical protein
MSIAYVQEFPATDDRTTTNYDSIKERLNVEGDRPDGLIIHTAGFTSEGVFRIFDVWESSAQHTEFRNNRLMPIVEDMMQGGSGGPMPSETTYDLHDVVRG